MGIHRARKGRAEIDAHHQAVVPGFIDMMGYSEQSLLLDGRGVSGLKQGVTLDIFSEIRWALWRPEMAERMVKREGDLKYEITWTIGEYLEHLEHHGIAPNIASFLGDGAVRVNVLGEGDVTPPPQQLASMGLLVHQAMDEGALGLTTQLIYVPENYAKIPELIAMAKVIALWRHLTWLRADR